MSRPIRVRKSPHDTTYYTMYTDEPGGSEAGLDVATLYVALMHLNDGGRRWSWFDRATGEWVQGDSPAFGDAIAAAYAAQADEAEK